MKIKYFFLIKLTIFFVIYAFTVYEFCRFWINAVSIKLFFITIINEQQNYYIRTDEMINNFKMVSCL